MKKLSIVCHILTLSPAELSEADRRLAEAAMSATSGSYSPYSHFRVGAALLLTDGTVVCGSNQENAAYPSGLCAERTALFAAGALHPHTPVQALAIAARQEEGTFTPLPCPPCGACRQVLLETETRHGGTPIRIILYGSRECHIIEGGAASLLPLHFGEENFQCPL